MDYSHPEVLIEAGWLLEHLDDPHLRILEVGDDELAYIGGHIPGAVFWNAEGALLDADWRTIEDPAMIAGVLGKAGVAPETTVVLVSRYPAMAAWGFWYLRIFGHEQVVLMNGGMDAWKAIDGPTTREVPSYEPANYPTPVLDQTLRADIAVVRAAIGDPGTVLIDARSLGEYNGEWAVHSAPTDEERGGHIPGAKHIYFQYVLGEDKLFKPSDELRALFAGHGVTPDKSVIVYCTIGMRAAHTLFTLHYLLEYPRVRSYDLSWNEWCRLPDTPIES